jgi:voltage-gated potassium channel Kch
VIRTHVWQFGVRRLERAFETGRILPLLMLAIALLAFVSGVLIWVVDRDDFPTLGVALWWAVATVTTVGYGDVVPTEPAGRAVASGLMIVGYASLSLLTGVVASLLVARRSAAQLATEEQALDRIGHRLAEVERLLREQSRSGAE